MAQVGTLTVDLIAQTASFNSNITKAAANLNSSTARMNRSLASIQSSIDKTRGLATHLGEAFLLKEAAEGVKHLLDFAGGLKVQAQQIGLTAEQLQVYRYAAQQSGVQQDQFDIGVRKLTASLGKASVGAEGQAKTFAALGISVRDANGNVKTTGDLLPELADRLSKVSSPAQRAAVEMQLLGRSGQSLDPLLTKGSAGMRTMEERAKSLGLVLSNDLAEQAHEADIRVEELETQLKVNIAGVVAQNADAILGLASAVATLTGRVIQFISQYPRFSGALAGVAIGSRAGLPGAIAGGALGYVAGNYAAGQADDQNMNLQFRLKKLNAARANLENERKVSAQDQQTGQPIFRIRRGTGLQAAIDETKKQTALTNQALAVAKQPKTPAAPSIDLPNFMAPKGGHPHEQKDPLADAAERFGVQLDQINSQILEAKARTLVEADDIAKIDKLQVEAEIDRQKLSIDKDVKDKHITAAQGDELKAKLDILKTEQERGIDLEKAKAKAEETLNVELAANDNQKDILQGLDALSTTQADRRKTQLALLDLDKQEEKLRLQQIIDLGKIGAATQAEVQVAQDRLNKLDEVYGLRAAGINLQTQSPLAAYLQGIPKTASEIGERVESLQVDELESVRQGIDNAITKVLGVKDPLLAGLLDLFIQENLIRPIASALEKANSNGGGLGGFLGKLLHIGASLAPGVSAGTVASLTPDVSGAIAANPGIFANGTTGAPGGLSIVGERGPELLRLPTGAQVIPNHRLPRISAPSNDNRVKVEIVDTTGLFITRVNGQIAQAAPGIMRGGGEVGVQRLRYAQTRRVG